MDPKELGLVPCPGCGHFIDPITCGCGESKECHSAFGGHPFIPQGCACFRDARKLGIMKPLQQCEEVMLIGLAAAGAQMDHFNPYYGIVVKDHGVTEAAWKSGEELQPGDWMVTVLWEDGLERKHPRNVLMSISELKKELRR